jgi:hypothetical protein
VDRSTDGVSSENILYIRKNTAAGGFNSGIHLQTTKAKVSFHYRARAQGMSRRILAAEAGDRSQSGSYANRGAKNGNKKGFSSSSSAFTISFIKKNILESLIHRPSQVKQVQYKDRRSYTVTPPPEK